MGYRIRECDYDHWCCPSNRVTRLYVALVFLAPSVAKPLPLHIHTVAMFVIARFLLGFGIPFAIVAASSMIGELAYPKERARMGSLFNASWFIGAIVAAGVTLGTFQMPSNWGWRIPSILQVVPSVLQITFIWFLPESPRWLIARGRGEEAYAILAKYHAEGDVASEFVKLEYAEIEKTLELEREQQKGSWREFVLAPGMRKRLLICSFLGLATQWSGNGLTSYFLARILDNVGIHDDRTKNLINLAMTCWGFVNGTGLALTMPQLPRRTAYLACTVSLTLIFTGWTVASARYAETGSQGASRAVIAFIFLYSPAYNMAYNALTYSACPGMLFCKLLLTMCPVQLSSLNCSRSTRVRRVLPSSSGGVALPASSTSLSTRLELPTQVCLPRICSLCCRFTFVTYRAGWKYYISYCVFLLFEIVFVYFLFPETSNRSLEELAFRKSFPPRYLKCDPNSSIQCSKARRSARSNKSASTTECTTTDRPMSQSTRATRRVPSTSTTASSSDRFRICCGMCISISTHLLSLYT